MATIYVDDVPVYACEYDAEIIRKKCEEFKRTYPGCTIKVRQDGGFAVQYTGGE